MPPKSKVVSLEKLTTFILEDFEVFRRNLENAAKVLEEVRRHWGFDQPLTSV
jgi:hypothetical protein